MTAAKQKGSTAVEESPRAYLESREVFHDDNWHLMVSHCRDNQMQGMQYSGIIHNRLTAEVDGLNKTPKDRINQTNFSKLPVATFEPSRTTPVISR